LGYNTAVFCALYRLNGVKNVINMDGLEWRRGKWGGVARMWFRLNERLGAWLSNVVVADHPEIARRLQSMVPYDKIHMIPYAAEILSNADEGQLLRFGLEKRAYVLVIARPEKENLILEIVRAFSRQRRGVRLVILGRYTPDKNEYHRSVLDSASEEVVFLGAIYRKEVVQSLRFHARLYIHGHTVGGTNPSLVEALGAGSAVLAHDNVFNRWVAGEGAHYFVSEEDCARELDSLLINDGEILAMQAASKRQLMKHFTAHQVYEAYEGVLGQWQ
jgi:glycosyltransferase involved in cell wall biosynthesis